MGHHHGILRIFLPDQQIALRYSGVTTYTYITCKEVFTLSMRCQSSKLLKCWGKEDESGARLRFFMASDEAKKNFGSEVLDIFFHMSYQGIVDFISSEADAYGERYYGISFS
ncbi:hypothetical protein EYC84_010810 [Monilinia fructicola]|uniref:Uncharacterized protein n=1 Tax=Monilinia fructicola TaxID=38448 RepID=A0A5M9J876_MONFR|nr:hypothetical protein EYC84_010810 [Monilinia fructicola]